MPAASSVIPAMQQGKIENALGLRQDSASRGVEDAHFTRHQRDEDANGDEASAIQAVPDSENAHPGQIGFGKAGPRSRAWCRTPSAVSRRSSRLIRKRRITRSNASRLLT